MSIVQTSTREILVIEDDRVLSQLLTRELARGGHTVSAVGRWSEAAAYLETHAPNLVVTDVRLPDVNMLEKLPALAAEQPVLVLTAFGTVQDAVAAMKAGAADYLVKPVDLEELEIVIERTIANAALADERAFLREERDRASASSAMVGASAPMHRVRSLIDAVAPTGTTVLIEGESGVGKELVARAIHAGSDRGRANFVAVDCCTLQPNLFESELFGHERGAFTGADRQKKGLIEGAAGGTLFLDEIGETEPALQAKLLRVLETGTFRRVGGVKDLRADVRIIAATNRDLKQLCADGRFRLDLYFRLNVFSIVVPPLRARRDDIAGIAEHFLARHRPAAGVDKVFGAAAMQRLLGYDFPGNVRELRNIVERAVIVSGPDREIKERHLALGPASPGSRTALTLSFDHEPTVEELDRSYLELMLRRYGGHRGRVAQILSVSERSVYRMLRRMDDAAVAEPAGPAKPSSSPDETGD